MIYGSIWPTPSGYKTFLPNKPTHSNLLVNGVSGVPSIIKRYPTSPIECSLYYATKPLQLNILLPKYSLVKGYHNEWIRPSARSCDGKHPLLNRPNNYIYSNSHFNYNYYTYDRAMGRILGRYWHFLGKHPHDIDTSDPEIESFPIPSRISSAKILYTHYLLDVSQIKHIPYLLGELGSSHYTNYPDFKRPLPLKHLFNTPSSFLLGFLEGYGHVYFHMSVKLPRYRLYYLVPNKSIAFSMKIALASVGHYFIYKKRDDNHLLFPTTETLRYLRRDSYFPFHLFPEQSIIHEQDSHFSNSVYLKLIRSGIKAIGAPHIIPLNTSYFGLIL